MKNGQLFLNRRPSTTQPDIGMERRR